MELLTAVEWRVRLDYTAHVLPCWRLLFQSGAAGGRRSAPCMLRLAAGIRQQALALASSAARSAVCPAAAAAATAVRGSPSRSTKRARIP
ncbi:hypothetical protein C2E20_7189 [Micractinium conductrix]|uniref:Uncharacterized protein n=1 Tax=Micractinium conductrix TaxID=554055 RepID=A0A2P6V563_9CHLO|nr:hypothetical protein C2E20_7189 [Micractinium conductrix]|eukprot:PSC69224.1 hypothetical protein C2E20_7189 [Micractinium conductrix]